LADGPRIINPFATPPSKDELAYNCSRWAQVAKAEFTKQHITKLGFIFQFFYKDSIGRGVGVLASNVNNSAVKDELAAVVRRFSDQRRIVVPGGD